jgi:hypothetical protein
MLVYDVGYASMLNAHTTYDKEHAEARDKFVSIFEDAAWEYETGLPAIARRFGDATVAGAAVMRDRAAGASDLPSSATASGGKL